MIGIPLLAAAALSAIGPVTLSRASALDVLDQDLENLRRATFQPYDQHVWDRRRHLRIEESNRRYAEYLRQEAEKAKPFIDAAEAKRARRRERNLKNRGAA